MSEPAPTDVAVIILTYNEQENLPHALGSIGAWARETWVLDSGSVDATVSIARRHGCRVAENRFVDYASQRNFALQALDIEAEWIFFLDADEQLTEQLKGEISEMIARSPAENGFYVKRRFIWMGTWIRRGYYPTWILRLFRKGTGRCEDRPVNEHIIVEGEVGYLQHDFLHDDRKGVHEWITKHNQYATQEATELLRTKREATGREISARLGGGQAERKRWLRHRVWNRLPPLIRPFLYFFYRYLLAGGFLDGWRAFSFHFLQALWYPMLIDIKYLELVWKRRN